MNTATGVLVTSVPSISSSAVYAELSISVWTGRKLDKRATKETCAGNGAADGMGSFHKKLMGDCASLDAVQKFAANARNAHYYSTMPWSDLGMRLLPTTMYAEYVRAITETETEFVRLVNVFLGEYEWAQAEAQARLGSLYNPDDYPSRDSLSAKFRFRHAQTPVPDAGDFRLDIGAEASAIIAQQYRKHYAEQLHNAMGDVWQRTYDALKKMSDKLDYTDGEDKDTRKIFRDSLVSNVQDMIGLLAKFNVTGDARMEEMRVQLEDAMTGVSPEALRGDDEFRADTKARVDAVLNSMKW